MNLVNESSIDWGKNVDEKIKAGTGKLKDEIDSLNIRNMTIWKSKLQKKQKQIDDLDR